MSVWYNEDLRERLGTDARENDEMFNKKKAMKTQTVELTCPRCGLILEIAVEPGSVSVPCVCNAEIPLSPENQQAA